MGISSMDMCFILKIMSMEERNKIMEFMLRDRLLMSLKLTIIESSKRSLNSNIIASIIKYFYSNIIGMTPLTEE
jgi:hypothetical protein